MDLGGMGWGLSEVGLVCWLGGLTFHETRVGYPSSLATTSGASG